MHHHGRKASHDPQSFLAAGNGAAFRRNGSNYRGYSTYECSAPTLKYLPAVLPQISLVGGQTATKPLLISNGFGDSSWGGVLAPAPGPVSPHATQCQNLTCMS